MKNSIFFKVTVSLLLAAVLAIVISSCKKNEATEAPRIFKPGELSVIAGETSAKLTWAKPLVSTGKSYTYQVEISSDLQFTDIIHTATTTTLEYTITESNLKVREKYYARIKALAIDDQPESKYTVSSQFSLTGTQRFLPIYTPKVKETSVTLYFKKGVMDFTSIVVTPASGAPNTVSVSSADWDAKNKTITGLSPATAYSVELFTGTVSKGYLTFNTLAITNYSVVLSSGADLTTAINSAANGAIIGLNPGVYDLPNIVSLNNRTITLKSTSSEPSDTKVTSKGFYLFGNGSGLKVSGIDFDGGASNYFVDIPASTGNTTATFTSLIAENCYIHNFFTSIIRGDRSTVNSYTIGEITFRNCRIYDITGSSSYYVFHIDEMLFTSLNISECTFYNIGPGLINFKTTTTPGIVPTVNIGNSTFNFIGSAGLYLFMNAGANPVNFSMTNTIAANAPKSSTLLGLINATAPSGLTLNISRSNFYNLMTAVIGGTALTFPAAATTSSNLSINPGWRTSDTQFPIAEDSALQTASGTGTPIGDPLWLHYYN
jgi:hypothetical protein